jgi:hypothetical protein
MVYFQTNKKNWENFGGHWIGKCSYMLWPYGIFTEIGDIL